MVGFVGSLIATINYLPIGTTQFPGVPLYTYFTLPVPNESKEKCFLLLNFILNHSVPKLSLLDINNIETFLNFQEICARQGLRRGPQMFVGSTDRFDINQGEIGNCWFLAALANLVENKRCFHRVVPQRQGFGESDYCGLFRFRFWRFGEWVEIVVDDRLPTRNGKLIYLRCVRLSFSTKFPPRRHSN